MLYSFLPRLLYLFELSLSRNLQPSNPCTGETVALSSLAEHEATVGVLGASGKRVCVASLANLLECLAKNNREIPVWVAGAASNPPDVSSASAFRLSGFFVLFNSYSPKSSSQLATPASVPRLVPTAQ